MACRHLGGRLRGCVRTILAQLHLQRPPTALFRPFPPQTQTDIPQPHTFSPISSCRLTNHTLGALPLGKNNRWKKENKPHLGK